MHRPENKPIRSNPAAENNRSSVSLSSGGHKKTNMGNSSGGKVTNPMEIPNNQGFVGKRIKT